MSNDIIKVYTGSLANVEHLKADLEEIGVSCFIKDDFQASITAGFVSSVPTAIDLYIQESDMEKAKELVADFKSNNL
jgi:hypothetical protein